MAYPGIALAVIVAASPLAAQTTVDAGNTQIVPRAAPATLTGEWGGLRTRLRDDGIDLTASYGTESATNVSGGARHRVTEAGQFVFGTTVDAEKLSGISGGTFQATITYRRGKDLGADVGLGVLQQVQEVYGRGQTWRLTQLWYQQVFAGGHATE